MERKLHIGGKIRHPEWEVMNIAPGPCVDHVGDALDLARFPDGSFEAVYGSHVLEHFDFNGRLQTALKEWGRVLSPAGKLYVSVPDLDVLCTLILLKQQLNVAERMLLMRMMFGGHTDPFDYHYVGLNRDILCGFLGNAGFTHMQVVKSFGFFDDTSTLEFKGVPISLNVVAWREAA